MSLCVLRVSVVKSRNSSIGRDKGKQPMQNLLIKGDNLQGLNYLLEKRKLRGKIDLVYIDPPFATGSNFTITDGRASTISNSRN